MSPFKNIMKAKIKFLRKAKYWSYRLGIHRLLPAEKLNFSCHAAMVSKWISEHKDLVMTDFPTKKFDYNKRFEIYKHILDHQVKDGAMDYFEFGVSKGVSFKWWNSEHTNPDSQFFGFDTFTGLPEDWGPLKAGSMSNGNEQPEIDGNRHSFYQGIFQDTLFKFLETYNPGKKMVFLMDADLYSSTLFVLTTMSRYLKSGDIIIFDEFNVPLHEFKAFHEWSTTYYIDYEVIAEVNNYYCVAIKIK